MAPTFWYLVLLAPLLGAVQAQCTTPKSRTCNSARTWIIECDAGLHGTLWANCNGANCRTCSTRGGIVYPSCSPCTDR
ncbi:hypothetical protein COCSADRAFT_303170 [Bipolaris sorokiniana ND90Pr]|uniref:Uncharacterized protein n=1 Tax=Cochliobolus sativus (strain ND90Pr / ATCC 201652) TaxID=665912 RepID=M2SX13_COCSN|nr:uncharacterized protein COCSADRAFT_303170 [Bipolaris sorokiniana ND90Pr]EMD66850.1 hypothetical protein COCSADRAFT_303170 [Bipolaris sorokiniana ND90Pr]